ncbi:TrfB-related DNA-binding protein [Pseudomonas syringae]|uniref:TrfB-related DNA-binding protein n=1 Tax=Pseudomonas syringae TaxID=317 RepID=UPI0002098DF7|nr:TrfB-related DNA-binding protein [Pseudomonas syringae]MDP5168571.1 TrfB-related DNA-binding protein [Pseudomonas syringae pv. aptata str. DSM 50252]
MKRTMTAAQFEQVTKNLDMSERTKLIAFGVLVEGRTQAEFVEKLNVTPGAISQIIARVWKPFERQKAVPVGFQRVNVILPEHQAFIVKKWSRAALDRMENSEEI